MIDAFIRIVDYVRVGDFVVKADIEDETCYVLNSLIFPTKDGTVFVTLYPSQKYRKTRILRGGFRFMNDITNYSHYIILNLPKEKVFECLTREFGDDVLDPKNKENLTWREIDLSISVEGNETGPFWLKPRTSSSSVLKRFFQLGKRYGIKPIDIIRRVLVEYSAPKRVQQLDNEFYFYATCLAFVPLIVSYLLSPIIDPRFILFPYLSIWSIMYIIYRYGVWKEAVDFRLLSTVYGHIIVLVVCIFIPIFTICTIFYQENTIIISGMLMVFILTLGSICCGEENRVFGYPRKQCIKRWNRLTTISYSALDKREQSIVEDAVCFYLGAANYFAISTVLALLLLYLTGFGEYLSVQLASSWEFVIPLFAFLLVTPLSILDIHRKSDRGHLNNIRRTRINLDPIIKNLHEAQE